MADPNYSWEAYLASGTVFLVVLVLGLLYWLDKDLFTQSGKVSEDSNGSTTPLDSATGLGRLRARLHVIEEVTEESDNGSDSQGTPSLGGPSEPHRAAAKEHLSRLNQQETRQQTGQVAFRKSAAAEQKDEVGSRLRKTPPKNQEGAGESRRTRLERGATAQQEPRIKNRRNSN